ncbi:MAG: hypothetical protein KKD75_02235 [Nanoarchaeota archaeon]|nr:hypothetical protein [Nanoarchaeota archaeon]
MNIDDNPPNVFDLIPIANSSFNVTTAIEIAANVTDDFAVHTVLANITFPNNTVQQLTLINVIGDKYNTSFTIPNLIGTYNVTFWANDTSNNINATETTFFVGNDVSSPNVTLVSPDDNYWNNTSDPFNVTFNCSVTDDVELVNISLYITNSSNQSFSLYQTTNISGTSNSSSWTLSLENGDYTWNCLAYDTSGNFDWGDANKSIIINYTHNYNFTYLINETTTTIYGYLNGTLTDLLYNESIYALQLSSSNSNGNYLSNVFDVNGIFRWVNISWVSNDIGELPNNQSYDSYANMSGNVLLLHFNNDSTYGENDTFFYDYSGSENNGTCNQTAGTCPTYDDSGRFSKALDFDGLPDNNTVTVPYSQSLNITQNFTIEAWVTRSSTDNDMHIAARDESGARIYALKQYDNKFEFKVWKNNFFASTLTGTTIVEVNESKWYHVVGVYSYGGDGSSTMDLYVNGQKDQTTATTAAGPINDLSSPLYVGFRGIGDGDWEGKIDEVAIFNRSLSEQEIINHYKKGALRLNASIRSCDDASCSGESLVDIEDISPQNLSLASNRYIQYNFDFETDSLNYSPELYNVTIHYLIDYPPNVTLISPADSYTSNTSNVVFECNVTDDVNLANISLYITNSSNESFSLYQTTNISGISNSTSWNLSLSIGNYTWNCLAYDSVGQSDWGDSNRSLEVNYTDTIDPNITIITPLDYDIVGWTVLLRANVTDNYNLASVTFEIRNGTLSAPVIASGIMNNIGGDIFNATLITNATWPYNNTLLNSTNLTFVVYANDTSGNTANASTYWILDNTKPNIQHITPPQSGAFYNSNFTLNIWLSNTLLNYSEYNITNSSGSIVQTNSTSLSSTTYTWSEPVNVDALPDGNYTLITYAQDYIGNNNTKHTWFYIDHTPPNVTIDNETGWIPPTPANNTYTNVLTHTFNMTCNESFVDTVWIDFNGTINSTPFNSGTSYWWTFTLAEGTYTYTGYCNDTAGNNASTETRILNIDLTNPNVILVSPVDNYANDTSDPVNVTFECNATDNYGLDNISLYITNNQNTSFALNQTTSISGTGNSTNWTLSLANGNYTWNCLAYDTSGNNDWGDSNISLIINYSDQPPYWSNNQTSIVPIYSPTTQSFFNITWQDDYGVSIVWFESNYTGTLTNYSMNNVVGDVYNYSAILPAGTHYWKSYANDTADQWNETYMWNFTIAKASSSCTLDVSSSPVTYGTQTQANCTCDNPEAAAILYRNGTDVTITENGTLITLPAGDWYYVCNTTETQNYTNVPDNNWTNVTKAAGTLNLLINGSTDDFRQNVSFSANITCSLTTPSSGNITIYEDGTLLNSTIGSTLTHFKTYTTPADYNITCILENHQNYTASDQSWVNATDEDSLSVTLEYPPANYWNDTSDPFNINFNCSATDNYNLRNISLWITNNQNTSFALNQSSLIAGTSNSSNWTVSLSNGNYTWNCLAYDEYNNSAWGTNRTVTINYTAIESNPPIVTLVSPANNTEDANGYINFKYNVTDESNISSCELILNGSINQNSSNVLRNITQTFTVSNLSNGNYTWSVNCTDINSNEGSSETWLVIVNKSEEANITVSVFETINTYNDTFVYAYVDYIDSGSNFVDFNHSGSIRNGSISSGTYNIRVTPINHTIQEILIVGANIIQNVTKIIDIDDPNETTQFASALYAVDLSKTSFNFSYVNITLTATGRVLYKCPAWNYSLQTCPDNRWKKRMNLIPGQNYTIQMQNASDPGFGEDNRTINVLDKDDYFINNTQVIINETIDMQDVNITWIDHLIDYMVVYQHNISIFRDDVRLDNPPYEQGYLELYAIDTSDLDFTNLTTSINASGYKLYTCAQWNITTRNCYGSWVENRTLTPGQVYDLTIAYQNSSGYGESGTTRTVQGAILKNNSNPAQNATVIVHTQLDQVCNCSTTISSVSYTNANGTYTESSSNLRFDNDCSSKNKSAGDDCDALWDNNDELWITVDGSTVIPSSQGNGSSPFNPALTWEYYYLGNPIFADVINATLAAGAFMPLTNYNFTYLINETDTTIYGYLNGTLNNTFYNDSIYAVQLNATYNNGSYTSNVFDVEINASWNNISWMSSAIGELPDNNEVETKFVRRNANMTNNILLMHMNEGFGTIVDSSGEGNNGSALGGVTYGAQGKLDSALSFDGVDDRVDINQVNKFETAPFTVSLWFNLNQLPSDKGESAKFIIKRASVVPGSSWYVNMETDNYVWFHVINAVEADTGIQSDSNLTNIETWYHVVAVLNSSYDMSLYFNGVQQSSTANSGSIFNSDDLLRIGADTNNSDRTNGTLDEVAIWNRTLSSDEIRDLYIRGITRLNLSLRSCNDDNCSGESFMDLNDTSPQNLSVANNQFIQYKFNFETDDTNYTPELYNVTIHYSSIDNPPYWSNNQTSIVPTYSPTTQSLFNITWQDDNAVSIVWFESNYSGSAINYSMNNITTSVYNYSAILPAGMHYWKSYANDTIDQWNISNQWTFNIAKAAGTIALYINGSTDDFRQNVSFPVNITCTLTTPTSGNLTIYENGVVLNSTIGSTLTHIKTYTTPADYNITCILENHQNYTASDQSWVNATDEDSLSVMLEYPPVNYWNDTSDPFSINFNCSATDNYNLRNISLWITNYQNTSFALNQSSLISGISNSSNWTASLANGNYTWNCLAYDEYNNSAWGTNRTVTINYTAALGLPYPPNFMITKINVSAVFLNWSEVVEADTYNIYYSSNPHSLNELNASNISADITQITNITALNYTDTNIPLDQLRFYRVSSYRSPLENVSPVMWGKQTFIFYGTTGTGNSYHRANWIGFALNVSLYAEEFLDNIGNESIRMSKLDKNNATDYSVVVHTKDFAANNFSLEAGKKYTVETNSDKNHTIVGRAILSPLEMVFYGVTGTGNSYHRANWNNLPYSNITYYAESLLDEIGNTSIRISKLEKNNATDYSVVVHTKDFAANNFTIIPGEGYTIETNMDVNFTPQG